MLLKFNILSTNSHDSGNWVVSQQKSAYNIGFKILIVICQTHRLWPACVSYIGKRKGPFWKVDFIRDFQRTPFETTTSTAGFPNVLEGVILWFRYSDWMTSHPTKAKHADSLASSSFVTFQTSLLIFKPHNKSLAKHIPCFQNKILLLCCPHIPHLCLHRCVSTRAPGSKEILLWKQRCVTDQRPRVRSEGTCLGYFFCGVTYPSGGSMDPPWWELEQV